MHALKIRAVEQRADGRGVIVPDDPGYAPFSPEGNWFSRSMTAAKVTSQSDLIGGYYVVYDDGYTSYSPAKAFEEGYARI